MITIAQLARVAKHARGKVDAVDASGWSDRLAQEREIPAGAAPHVEDAVTVLEAQAIDRVLAQPRGNEEQPIEERNDIGEAIVALADEIRVVIHPLIGHASLPHSQTVTTGSSPYFAHRSTPASAARTGSENRISAWREAQCRIPAAITSPPRSPDGTTFAIPEVSRRDAIQPCDPGSIPAGDGGRANRSCGHG